MAGTPSSLMEEISSSNPAERTDLSLLHLLQLADSAFPTGAFAHSLGLEGLAQLGWFGGGPGPAVHLAALLRARLNLDLARIDLPLLLLACEHAARHATAELLALDALAAATRTVGEWRLAGARTGRRLLAAVLDFAPHPLLTDLSVALAGTDGGPQLPIAFGVAAQTLGCAAAETAYAYAMQTVSGQLAAAVRLGLIGQRATQRIIHALKGDLLSAVQAAATVPLAEIGSGLPLLEIAGMRHAYAEERLFTS